MDQFNAFDVFDTVYPKVKALLKPEIDTLLLPQSNASNASNAYHALTLPPLAIYPSRETLFEAIQSWAKPRGYAFTVGKVSVKVGAKRCIIHVIDAHLPYHKLYVYGPLNLEELGTSFRS